MIRLLAALLLAWMLGFLWFAIALPQPVEGVETDAVIVTTGGPGRIDRGLEILEDGDARQLFVSGVDPDVTAEEFAAEFDVARERMDCCVTLGFTATDTRSNAEEVARWLEESEVTSLRLVTSDWHMRRAASELSRVLPADVTLVRDAVSGSPTLSMLFLEYHKLIFSVAARLAGY